MRSQPFLLILKMYFIFVHEKHEKARKNATLFSLVRDFRDFRGQGFSFMRLPWAYPLYGLVTASFAALAKSPAVMMDRLTAFRFWRSASFTCAKVNAATFASRFLS